MKKKVKRISKRELGTLIHLDTKVVKRMKIIALMRETRARSQIEIILTEWANRYYPQTSEALIDAPINERNK